MNSQNTKEKVQKPKIPKIALAALSLGVIGVVLLSMLTDCYFTYVQCVLGLIAPVASLVLAGVALRRIRKSYEMLIGRGVAIAAIGLDLFLVLLVFALFFASPNPRPSPKTMCGINLKGLGTAIRLYANDFDSLYPTGEKWCDSLISFDYTSMYQFICPGSGAERGESSYALNKNVAGKKVSDILPDTVVLFETNFGVTDSERDAVLGERYFYKTANVSDSTSSRFGDADQKVFRLRWNQVGGPEILTVDNHQGKGCNVLFGNGYVEFVKTKRLGQLKWQFQDEAK